MRRAIREGSGATVEIRQAAAPRELDAVRGLMRAFVEWHYVRHADMRDLIDRYFDPVSFRRELDSLPGEFAPPRGRLLVAEHKGNLAGCVALRSLGEGDCEMKRMFVHSRFQGLGIGRALAGSILSQAREAGYRRMRLDTGPLQSEAISLYESLGFRRIDPYYNMPHDLRDTLVFMELDLTDPTGHGSSSTSQ